MFTVLSSRLVNYLLLLDPHFVSSLFFFFNDPATTEIYTLSLHDALPISSFRCAFHNGHAGAAAQPVGSCQHQAMGKIIRDRKSTRLNSSHVRISYAVFCLKKKNNYTETTSNVAGTNIAYMLC